MSGNDMVDAVGDGGHADETDARGQSRRLPRMSEAAFSSLQYDMCHQNRGVAVIISNINFQSKIDERAGYSLSGKHEPRDSADATAMYNLLQTLGFKTIQTFKDQTAAKMRTILQDVASINHANNDCFLCVILTHGDHGYVYATDDIIPVDELVQPFKGDRCPSLVGKPKIFLIQSSKDFMPEEEADMLFHECCGEEADEGTIRRIPTEADILLAYSLIPAWKNCLKQSWFIQAICEVFSQNCQTMDLMTMITRVNKKVAYCFETTAKEEFESHHRQIPCITSMLTKDVVFTQ